MRHHALAAIAALCVSAIAPTGLFAADKIYVKEATPLLSVASDRSGKGLKNLDLNELVTVIYIEEDMANPDRANSWVRVRTADGHEGFVHMRYLSKEKQPEPEFKVMARAVEGGRSYVNATSLYVREEPSRSAAERGMLVRNTPVTILAFSDEDDYIDGRTAKWANIQADDLTGWVFSGYLSDEQSNSSGSTAHEPKEDPEHINRGSSKDVKPPFLSVRDEPTKFGTIVGRIKQGKSVKILERMTAWENLAGLRSVWVRVRYDDLEGWVYGGFLTSDGYKMSSESLDKPFVLPLDPGVYRRTSKYGQRKTSFHAGVDLGAGSGTPIYAAGDGVIEKQETIGSYGLTTIVRHDNGLVTYYAHQSRYVKRLGDKVAAGDTIGEVGKSGAATGPHLHFEVRTNYGDTHFNPDLYVPFPEAPQQGE